MRTPRRLFEQALWGSRFVMLAAVVFSTLMALGVFYLATMDALRLPGYLLDYSDLALSDEGRVDLRAKALTVIVKSVDGYIITAILLIFSLGLYELFLGKLERARDSSVASRLLPSDGGLDDLKNRIAKLLVLVLVIEFFQRALRLEFEHALDLLYLAAGILLIGLTLYLTSHKGAEKNGGH